VPSPSPNAGIISTYRATAPPDFSGYYAETQLIETNPSTTPSINPSPFTETGNASWADACWIYGVDGSGQNHPARSFGAGASVTYGPTFDAPFYGLTSVPGLTGLYVDDIYTDYFMFLPKGSNHVWVNFGKLQWSWGGLASKGLLNTWILSRTIAPGPTETGAPNSDHVSWPNYIPNPDPHVTCPPTPGAGDLSNPRRRNYSSHLAPQQGVHSTQRQLVPTPRATMR
jgi:hypothetical protein